MYSAYSSPVIDKLLVACILYCSSHLSCLRLLSPPCSGEKDQLGVENFGLSVTTMEEVFIRVGQLAEEEKVEPAK